MTVSTGNPCVDHIFSFLKQNPQVVLLNDDLDIPFEVYWGQYKDKYENPKNEVKDVFTTLFYSDEVRTYLEKLPKSRAYEIQKELYDGKITGKQYLKKMKKELNPKIKYFDR